MIAMFIKTKYNLILSLIIVTGIVFIAGCNGKNKKNGKKIFHYNEHSGIPTLDPAFAKSQATMWPAHQLFNTLVEVNDSLKIVPSLAKRWQVSEDRLTYTFYLRNDVFFHNDEAFPGKKGRKLTAGDIAYSFYRIIDKRTASPGAWIFNRKVDTIQPFRAIDDTTFQLKLLRPYNPILGILSMQYCSIVAKEAVEKYGNEFRRHPVGTGPFRFVAWEEGQALILAKHENYFEKDSLGNRLPYVDGIKTTFYDSKATEFLLFRQNKLDFVNDIDASFKDEILTKKGTLRKNWEGKLILQVNPYLNIEYLGILIDSTNELVKGSPLVLRKVRQAINYGFDRKKMVLYLRNSIGTPAESGFVPMGLPSFDTGFVKGYSYDPVKSKRLLAEAGFENGNGLPVIKLLTIALYSDMADFIAKELDGIGIPVQVETIQKSLLIEMTSNSRALFFRGSWIADYPDAENYLSVFYSKNPAPPNYTRYKNPRFDDLFEKALVEENDSIRYRLYQQADQIVMNDAPVVPLWYDKVIRLVQPSVTGFKPNALNLLELRKVKLD
ncbi:ABC transporter substrate-binding protein [Terrimonas pollutisoli]|uniref:ABC transporter substrate-binding protein n=1 Tax=Terrimonas pollutisoli TaxID=3034147 RepID=UPI0023EB8088|nr:ABC transporter substrate-binding protein [Terrimonas sp. H1YJ31]